MEDYNVNTATVDSCEMALVDLINPINNSVYWTQSQVNDITVPNGWMIASSDDFVTTAQTSMSIMNWNLTKAYAYINSSTGELVEVDRGGRYAYYWVRTGEGKDGITSVKLWDSRTPSWNFQKTQMPNGSDNTLCKVRLVKSHQPKKIPNWSQSHKDRCTLSVLQWAYPEEYANEVIPELPTLTIGMNTGIIIPDYFLDSSVMALVNKMEEESGVNINMVWEQNTNVNLYYETGRESGALIYHFTSGVEYKFLCV